MMIRNFNSSRKEYPSKRNWKTCFYIRCSGLNPEMGVMEIDDVKERAVPKKIYENRLEKRNNFNL